MRRKIVQVAMLSLFACGSTVFTANAADQIVTQDVKEWAKKLIADESTLVAAPAQNSLVVLYYRNQTGRQDLNPLQKGMTLMLMTDLSQIQEIELVERVKLQALAEELGLGSSGLVDQQTAPRVGKLVRARWIAGGDFVGGAVDPFDTKSRVLNVTSSKIANQFSSHGSLADILKIEKELVFNIVDSLKIKLKPEVAAAVRKPCSTNLKALDALFRGIDASDRGEYQQAGELYNSALAADPGVCVAASALQELVRMGGYSNSNVSQRKAGKTGKAGEPVAKPTETNAAADAPANPDAKPAEASAASGAPSSPAAVDIFVPHVAIADVAVSVSGQTSLTNQVIPKDTVVRQPQQNIVQTKTTPVTIRINFP
jgi:hypothetical protein